MDNSTCADEFIGFLESCVDSEAQEVQYEDWGDFIRAAGYIETSPGHFVRPDSYTKSGEKV